MSKPLDLRRRRIMARSTFAALVLGLLVIAVLSSGSKFQMSLVVGGNGSERLVVYDFRPGVREPHHLDPVDISLSLTPRPGLVGIDNVHLQGMVHSGMWMFVVDSDSRILVMKRGPQLVTCPNMWSLLGEHTLGREPPLATAKRGVKEELGTHILGHIRFFRQLTPDPLYYYREYGPSNRNRIDRQFTWVWWTQLDVPGSKAQLEVDEEVAEYRWLSVEEMEEWIQDEQGALDEGRERRLCDATILTLLKASLIALKKGFETKLPE